MPHHHHHGLKRFDFSQNRNHYEVPQQFYYSGYYKSAQSSSRAICSHVQCLLSSADASLWSNNCPSTAPFQSPIQVNSSSIEQNVSIHKSLSVAFSLENDCDFLHFPTVVAPERSISKTWRSGRKTLDM